jgi:phosphoribosylformylglycinamidine synthase
MTLDFKNEGDLIFLLGVSRDDIGSSEYVHKILGIEYSPAPYFDLEEEYALQQKVAGLIAKKLVVSAHDVSEGGLFITLAESAFPHGLGFEVSAKAKRADAYWFGESQSRVVVSVARDKAAAFRTALGGFPAEELGVVTGGGFKVNGANWGRVEEWKEKYDTALEKYMDQLVEME